MLSILAPDTKGFLSGVQGGDRRGSQTASSRLASGLRSPFTGLSRRCAGESFPHVSDHDLARIAAQQHDPQPDEPDDLAQAEDPGQHVGQPWDQREDACRAHSQAEDVQTRGQFASLTPPPSQQERGQGRGRRSTR